MADYQYINGVKVPLQNEQRSEVELLGTIPSFNKDISFNVNHPINAIENSLGATFVNGVNTGYSISDDDAKLARKYGIDYGMYDSRETFNKKLADAQSGWEQFGRSIGQIVVNEVFLGTLLGFSDLYDWFANLGKAYGEDDWNNPFGEALTKAQDSIKESWAIYRANPEKSFDMKDSGWWWDNFVTVGSTASLLIPSMTITKGLSLAGKGTRLALNGTKIDRFLHKSGRFLGKTAKTAGIENPYTVANTLKRATDVAVPAVISRQMEDMLEGRETYKQVYEDSMRQFETMTDKEREEFYKRNQDIIYDENGNLKSDEQIARYIADKAATYTFVNDFKYIGFDFLQFNSILRFGKKPLTRLTSNAQNRVLDNLAHRGETAAEGLIANSTRASVFKEGLKFYAKNPRIAIKQIAAHSEFTEGLEEMGQGITQDNALAEYEKFFNPNYSNRTLSSQLADPQLWEQGFWGMLGGIVFQGAGRGLKRGGKYVYKKLNQDKLSQQDIERLEATEESLREKEINSRANSAEVFKNKLELWKQGYNPQIKRYDAESGQELENDYTSTDGFTLMTGDEKGMVLEDIINEYMLNMTASAVEVGNGDLLESFIEDERFKKYISDLNSDDDSTKNIYDKILSKYKQVKELYYNNLNKVFGSIDVDSEYLGKALAFQLTRNSLYQDNIRNEIDRIDNAINDTNEDKNIIDLYHSANLASETGKAVNELLEQARQVERDRNEGKINKTFAQYQLGEIYRAVDKLLSNSQLSEVYSIIPAVLDEEGNIKVEEQLNKWLENYAKRRKRLNKYYERKNLYLEDIENLVEEFNTMLYNSSSRFENLEYEYGTPIDEVKDLIDDKIQQEIQLSIKESEELNSQEELQEAYDDMYAAATDIANNRLVAARDNIINWIEHSENPTEAFEDLMNERAPKDIQDQFDYFKIGHQLYAQHTAMFQMAALMAQRRNEVSNNTPEDVNDNEEEQEIIISESPSTGEQEGERRESPDIDAVIIQDEEEDIKTRDDVTDNINTRQRIRITLDNILIEKIFPTLTSEEKRSLREEGVESDVYKRIKSKLYQEADELRGKEAITDEELYNIANNSLAMYIKNIVDSIDNIEIKAKYNKFISDLLGLNETRSASTELVGSNTKKQDDAAKNIIDEYIKHIKGKSVDGKSVIDVDNLFEHLLNLYGEEVVSLINPILLHLQYHVNDYKITDISLITKYINHPRSLVEHLSTVKLKKNILGQADTTYGQTAAFHAQIPTMAQVGQRLVQDKKIEVPEDENIIEVRFTRFGEQQVNKKEGYREAAIQAYKDYIVAMNYYLTHDDCKIYAIDTGGSISYRICPNVPNASVEELKKEEYAPLEIGFVAKVDKSADNTTVKRIKYKNSKGLFFNIHKGKNNSYTSNMDNLFIPILNQSNDEAKRIWDLLNQDRNNDFTQEDIDFINNYFAELFNNDAIVINDGYKGVKTKNDVERLLYDYLYPILVDAPMRLNQDNLEESYHILKEKMFDNYIKTYEIQTNLAQGNDVEMDLKVAKYSVVNRDNTERNITKKEFDDKEKNKLVFVGNDGKIHIQDDDNVYDNPAVMGPDSVGITLDIIDGKPIVAWIQSRRNVSTNKQLYDSLFNVVKGLLNKYITGGRTKESSNAFYKSLSDLIHTNNSPFYVKDFKSIVNYIYNLNPNEINFDEVAKTILKDVKFNTSIQLINKKLDRENEFVEIKDDKIVIKLDEDLTYDDFFDFIDRTQAFTIDQSLTNELDDLQELESRNLFFSAMTETSSPVKGELIVGSYSATTNALKTANLRKSISTIQLLQAAGVSEIDINALLGKNSGITFIDDKVYYNKGYKGDAKAEYDGKSKKIWFTPNFTNNTDSSYRKDTYKQDLIRLLIHESVHKRFDELDASQKNYVLNELTKLFKASLTEILNDIENGTNTNIVIQLGDLFAHSKRTLITNEEQRVTYIKQRLQDIINDIDAGKVSNKLVEEYLAETLSQSAFMDYLNKKNYTGEQYAIADDTENNKTIWEKIVDLIVEFFSKFNENLSAKNLHNSENISIFANEYRLLASIGRPNIVNETVREVNNQTPINAETKEETEQEVIKDEDLTDADLDDINYETNEELNDDFVIRDATTNLVETETELRTKIAEVNGAVDISRTLRAKDMINFAATFGIDKQAEISSMIENGAFKYACK